MSLRIVLRRTCEPEKARSFSQRASTIHAGAPSSLTTHLTDSTQERKPDLSVQLAALLSRRGAPRGTESTKSFARMPQEISPEQSGDRWPKSVGTSCSEAFLATADHHSGGNSYRQKKILAELISLFELPTGIACGITSVTQFNFVPLQFLFSYSSIDHPFQLATPGGA